MNKTKIKEKITNHKGITLIALIITIIVMLILVAVTVSVALNGGLIGKAQEAKSKTEAAMEIEKNIKIEDFIENTDEPQEKIIFTEIVGNDIKIIYSYGNIKLSELETKLYKIALREDSETWYSYGEFENFFSSWNNLSDTMISKLDTALPELIESNSIQATQTDVTNSSGEVVFDGLDAGIYMVICSNMSINGVTYTPETFMFEVVEGADGGQTEVRPAIEKIAD